MTDADARPPVWVGHISLDTNRLDDSHDFMVKLGMRSLVKAEGFAVLELRAGTHLVLSQRDEIEPGTADFDLMVENIDETHARLMGLGIAPSQIEPGKIHSSFTVQDPCGHTIKFNSSHNSDHPV
jgi:catechol 2,3-dioxygenase-like lactoylglutathione lyase family enzyme